MVGKIHMPKGYFKFIALQISPTIGNAANSPCTRNPIITWRAKRDGTRWVGFTRQHLTRTKRDRAYPATRNIDHRADFPCVIGRFPRTAYVRHRRKTLPIFFFQAKRSPSRNLFALLRCLRRKTCSSTLPRAAAARLTIQYFQKPISR